MTLVINKFETLYIDRQDQLTKYNDVSDQQVNNQQAQNV